VKQICAGLFSHFVYGFRFKHFSEGSVNCYTWAERWEYTEFHCVHSKTHFKLVIKQSDELVCQDGCTVYSGRWRCLFWSLSSEFLWRGVDVDQWSFLSVYLNIVLLFMCIDTSCCESKVSGQQESDVKSLSVCLTFCRWYFRFTAYELIGLYPSAVCAIEVQLMIIMSRCLCVNNTRNYEQSALTEVASDLIVTLLVLQDRICLPPFRGTGI